MRNPSSVERESRAIFLNPKTRLRNTASAYRLSRYMYNMFYARMPSVLSISKIASRASVASRHYSRLFVCFFHCRFRHPLGLSSLSGGILGLLGFVHSVLKSGGLGLIGAPFVSDLRLDPSVKETCDGARTSFVGCAFTCGDDLVNFVA